MISLPELKLAIDLACERGVIVLRMALPGHVVGKKVLVYQRLQMYPFVVPQIQILGTPINKRQLRPLLFHNQRWVNRMCKIGSQNLGTSDYAMSLDDMPRTCIWAELQESEKATFSPRLSSSLADF